MEKTLEVGRTFDYFLSGARRDDERQEEQEVRAGYGRRRGDRKVDGFYQSLRILFFKDVYGRMGQNQGRVTLAAQGGVRLSCITVTLLTFNRRQSSHTSGTVRL